ncbi:MAG: hypothetical protein KDA52_08295 [Planctomycetaceae bacterium]|nr:hypothetical protein [Planctomycetaceae bacterium]
MRKMNQSKTGRRTIVLTGVAACAALMLMPDFSDAGWRRRARHGYGYQSACCCNNSNYGYGGHAAYGTSYSSGYAQTGQQYANESYAGQPIQQGPQPQQADNMNRGQQITANRPILSDSSDVPPPPGAQNRNNEQGNTQNVQQMRQRIDNLEQENARLRDQLEQARGNSDSENTATRNSTDAESRTQTNVQSDGRSDLPAPPDADADSSIDSGSEGAASNDQ